MSVDISLRQQARGLAEAEGISEAAALKRLQRQKPSQTAESIETPGELMPIPDWVDWLKASQYPNSRDRHAFKEATDFTDMASAERWCEMLNTDPVNRKVHGPARIDGTFRLEDGRTIHVVRRAGATGG